MEEVRYMEDHKVITKLQDLTYLKWSHIRSSSGTAGTFLKSESVIDGGKRYYKLSNYDPVNGVVGHECVNEIIVDRLLTLLEVEHVPYSLIHARIQLEGNTFETWLCESSDFKQRGESKLALDNYYAANRNSGESRLDFCIRNGWQEYVETMLAVDYLILNRDRHGANIEVLRNARAHSLRLAPLFDHGLSLLCSCLSEMEAERFDVMEDKRCQNFIGGYSCFENLQMIRDRKNVFQGTLKPEDRKRIFDGLEDALPDIFRKKIWDMIWERYKVLMG